MSAEVSAIAAGRFVFRPNEDSGLSLPDLPFLVFQHPEDKILPYEAVCVPLEIDSHGQTFDEAKANLRRAVEGYFNALDKFCKTTEEYIEKFLIDLYCESQEKDELFKIYHGFERTYLIQQWSQKNSVMPSNARSLFEEDMLCAPAMAI
jgi:predicted RNase H-like HicB family nuclease